MSLGDADRQERRKEENHESEQEYLELKRTEKEYREDENWIRDTGERIKRDTSIKL
jgi:hypothetical protein